jgi:predicted TIM-barrel fold metal-dependent hydrolase
LIVNKRTRETSALSTRKGTSVDPAGTTPWLCGDSSAPRRRAGVFEKFPRLKIVVAEAGVAWLP